MATERIRTFKFRLRPNKRQHADLRRILEDQRQLYNGALESRISYYAKTGKGMSLYAQQKELSILRADPQFADVPLRLQRATLTRLDRAYREFFRRLKTGEKAGFPRFRGKGLWDSFGFAEWNGIALRSNRLHFKGMSGGLRIHMHRQIPEGKVLCCQFRRDVKGWYVCLQVRLGTKALSATGRIIGIDLGISSLAVLSTGASISNPRITSRYERELMRRNRRLSRCHKSSNGRRKARLAVARLHAKIRNSRQTYLHQVSAKLVRENDIIAIEDLNVRGLAASKLAKSVNDVGWSTLTEFLRYKAENAGRQSIAVDPRNTTQACSGCGVIVPKSLGDRWHDCPDCGLSLDRDHNAALNILARSGAMGSQDRAKAAHV